MHGTLNQSIILVHKLALVVYIFSHIKNSRSVHKRLILLIEVLVLFEGGVQCEHYVQGFNDIIISFPVDRNVQYIASHSAIVLQAQVDLLAWQD